MISLIWPKLIRSFDKVGIYILGFSSQLFARDYFNNKKDEHSPFSIKGLIFIDVRPFKA